MMLDVVKLYIKIIVNDTIYSFVVVENFFIW
jgi:hypothetical protein